MSDASYTASPAGNSRDSAMCPCGHMRGIHKAAAPSPCANAGCGCKAFGARPVVQVAPVPPRIVQGRVERELPGTGGASPAAALPPRKAADEDAVARFARHLRGRMRVLGWDAAAVAAKTGLNPKTVSRAVNGTPVSMDVAVQLAGLVGLSLAVMVGPYSCANCGGEPPRGFRCLECGTEATA